MNTFLGTVRFARPYLARYWPRFVIGIVLGVLFGLSNSLLLGSVYLLSPRVTSPDEVHVTVEKGKEAKEAVSAQREQKANEPAAVSLPLAKVKPPSFMQNVVLVLDPWLPLRGRAMDWKQWVGGLLFLPAIFLLRGVLGYASSYCLAWSGQRITNDVRTDAFRKVSQQSLDYFLKTPTAEIIKRIDGDSASINNFLRMGLNDLVKEPATIAVCLAWMFSVNWKFTLLSLVYTPLCVIPARIVSKKVKDLGRKDFAASVASGSVTLESFQNVRITKAYALEEVHAAQFRKNSERSTRFFMKGIQSREMLNPAVQTLAALSISLVLLCAMWTNCDTKTLMTFIGALFMFGASVKKLNTMGVFYTQLSIALERLLGLFALKPSVKEIANPVPLTGFTRALEFRDVSFSYGDATVLQDVNFTLERGQRLGLAGESGSGKSSLINLLFPLLRSDQGRGAHRRRAAGPVARRRPALPHGAGQPGHPALQRHRGGEYRAGQDRRHARGGDHRREGSLRGQVHPGAAAGLRHAPRRARPAAERRPAPAHRHRARLRPQRAHPRPR